jgi:hypothetical protein
MIFLQVHSLISLSQDITISLIEWMLSIQLILIEWVSIAQRIEQDNERCLLRSEKHQLNYGAKPNSQLQQQR